MLKKALLLVFIGSFFNVLSAQVKKTPQLIKYVTTAPDGTTSITIFDDSRSNLMQLEATDGFYKYQLIDIHSNKEVLSRQNKGRRCTINKLTIADGTYDLRLFTDNFVISSRVTISAVEENSIASNE